MWKRMHDYERMSCGYLKMWVPDKTIIKLYINIYINFILYH